MFNVQDHKALVSNVMAWGRSRLRKRGLLAACLTMPAILILSAGEHALGDENAAANRLIVESSQLVKEARAADDPDEKMAHLMEALANFVTIVKEYPGSDIAVKIATGQPVGNLRNTDIVCQMWSACISAPTATCTSRTLALMVNAYGADDFFRNIVIKIASSFGAAQGVTGQLPKARDTFKLALALTSGLADEGDKANSLSTISYDQAIAGDLEGALETVERAVKVTNFIKDDRSKSLSLSGVSLARSVIAFRLALAGDFDGARKTAAEVMGKADRADAFRRIRDIESDPEEYSGPIAPMIGMAQFDKNEEANELERKVTELAELGRSTEARLVLAKAIHLRKLDEHNCQSDPGKLMMDWWHRLNESSFWKGELISELGRLLALVEMESP